MRYALFSKFTFHIKSLLGKFPGSSNYWEERYRAGGTSGVGSYGKLAEFKADFLNDFVKKKKIKSVIEFGCGDSNQITLFKFSRYFGLDVSKTAVEQCIEKFSKDTNKSFMIYSPFHFKDSADFLKADLTLSLDVIYHLVEDKVFDKYMQDLFNSAEKYVIIYSNKQSSSQKYHVRSRNFTHWISKNAPSWKFVKKVKNPHSSLSWADFYIYKKSLNRDN